MLPNTPVVYIYFPKKYTHDYISYKPKSYKSALKFDASLIWNALFEASYSSLSKNIYIFIFWTARISLSKISAF